MQKFMNNYRDACIKQQKVKKSQYNWNKDETTKSNIKVTNQKFMRFFKQFISLASVVDNFNLFYLETFIYVLFTVTDFSHLWWNEQVISNLPVITFKPMIVLGLLVCF